MEQTSYLTNKQTSMKFNCSICHYIACLTYIHVATVIRRDEETISNQKDPLVK